MSSLETTPKSFLHLLLIIFTGLLVAGFIGLGIAAFYVAPKAPTYPHTIQRASSYPPPPALDQTNITFDKVAQDQFNQDQEKYQTDLANYNRNTSSIALVAAIVILVLSLTILQNSLLIADGLLLGSIFTLIYSIIRATSTQNNQFEFFIVTIALGLTLILSYIKYVKPVNGKLRP